MRKRQRDIPPSRDSAPPAVRTRHGIFFRSLILLAAAAVCHAANVTNPRAQDETVQSVNYAFATQLGSGIYTVDAGIIQIYRITATIPFVEPDENNFGLRLRLPFTFGFYGFKFQDIIDTGLPENIGTLSLVPELEFEFKRRWPNWRFLPFVGFGGGKDFQGGSFDFIYAMGIRTYAWRPWKAFEFRFGNRVVYSGYTTKQLSIIDDFGLIETGVDFRRPLGFSLFGRPADGSVFGINFVYAHSPNLATLNETDLSFSTDWEVGVTLGTTDPIKVFGIGLPRIGLSYRFEPRSGAVRFVIGDMFPIASPQKRVSTIP
jgi:hypothetical protein